MGYLGTPIDTNNTFQSLQGKRFSGDGSATAFTLDIAPSSVFDIEVFVENVRQDPNSAYGISGVTLTFTSAPASGTNNIYVVHQAKAVGTIDVPASGVVPASLASNIISGQTALAATPADTDEFLISDAGTIKRIDFSHIKGQGKIAQVLQQEYATATAMSATSYADNGQTLAITPSATSSKILVIVECQIEIFGNGNNSDFGGRWKIVRTPSGGSGADAFVNPDTMLRLHNTHSGSARLIDRLNITHLDSPSTASSVTYKVMQQATSTDIQITSQIGSGKSKLTLMEVLA